MRHQDSFNFNKKDLNPVHFIISYWVKGQGWKEHRRCSSEKEREAIISKLSESGKKTKWTPLY